ncbi:MAG: LamG-like jellyroll fold domain-containing protein, partial [Bacteroidota bacterium]
MNNLYNQKTAFRLLWLLAMMTLLNIDSFAQNRNGSIDLSAGDGRHIKINRDHTNLELGIEGGAFTIESWVYFEEGSNQQFNLFRLISGSNRVTLHYRGDDYKNGQPWELQRSTNGGGSYSKHQMAYTASGYAAPDFSYTWRHVAFTVNSTNQVKLYVDGELVLEETIGSNSSLVLWPANGDGQSEIGGQALTGHSGKMLVAEVRVWDTQLSKTTISEYHDQEVSWLHPNWNKLVRYYTGYQEHDSGASDNYFFDISPTYTGYTDVNALVSNNDVKVNYGITPTVKPPEFNQSSVLSTFTANDCQTSDIDITWTDFDNHGTFRSGGISPKYELTRVSDGAVIYEGNAGSYSDSGVDPGNTESYQLRVYWFIDGVKVYADDVATSDYGSIKSQYSAPTGFYATDDHCDTSIDINWSWSGDDPPAWTLQRASNNAFTTGVTTLSSSLAGSARSYTDNAITKEITYYYRIIASGTDDNGCDVSGTYSNVNSGESSDSPAAPTNLSITVDNTNNEFDISWTNPSGNNATGYILTREEVNSAEDPVEFVINNTATTSYSDNTVTKCTSYRYKIAATNACLPDGVFSNSTQTALLGLDLSNVITSLEVSKGYYGSEVLLKWSVNGSASTVDLFEIERTIAGNDQYESIGSVTNNLFFKDESAIAGVFYNYRVVGVAYCDGAPAYTNELVELGFRQPFGIANGHIEYSGGNAVADAQVTFERQDGSQIGKSLSFDGVDDYVAIEDLTYEGTNYEAVTVETWIKTTKKNEAIIASFDASEYWRLDITDGNGIDGQVRFYTAVDGTPYNVLSTSSISDGEWHHVAGVFDNGVIYLYVDGEQEGVLDTGGSTFGSGILRYGFLGIGSETSSYNGEKTPAWRLQGSIDEIRIWEKAISAEEMALNYHRFLSNEEEGLLAYYRCDEGTGQKIYDTSKKEEVFNKHDATFFNGVSFSSVIPDPLQLGVRGTTDEFGDYSVGYIPFKGSGDIYRVVPSLGQHQFSPSSRSVYVGDGAIVHNNLDFEDISSFTVSGKVTYEDSEVPVEGVAIYVDGIQAVDGNNQAVRTDDEGNYTLDVPIGRHYLTAVKDHHTFSQGYFPALNEYGDIETHEFTEDLTVNFVDATKIKVAGRLVGGNIQADFPLGFGLSLNNVDVATIEFQLQKEGYDLDISDDG